MLCISEDEQAASVIEAWVLSVVWAEDAQGIERPTVSFGASKSKALAVALPAEKAKYTLNEVRQTSQTMLRQLSLMLNTLPPLPQLHWVSMRLIYRDHKTPKSYEPRGFAGTKGASAGLSFLSKPMQLSVAQPIATDYHTYRMHVVSTSIDDDELAMQPSGVMRAPASGRGQQARFVMDIGASVAGAPTQLDVEPDEETIAAFVERARKMVEMEADGAAFSSAALGGALKIPAATAERVLEKLEAEKLLSAFRPAESSRLVQHYRPRTRGGYSHTGSQSESEGEGGGSQESECSSSPAGRSASSVRTPTSAHTGPTTPGRGLKKRARHGARASDCDSDGDQENVAAGGREVRRKTSTTPTVQSKPAAVTPASRSGLGARGARGGRRSESQ